MNNSHQSGNRKGGVQLHLLQPPTDFQKKMKISNTQTECINS